MIDQRHSERTKVVRPAKWLPKGGGVCHVCIVDNFNALGACVRFDPSEISCLPVEFELSFDNFYTCWSCHVVWQVRGIADVEWQLL